LVLVRLKATVLRDVPWNALSFLFFNAFKSVYESLRNKAPAQADTMALGAVAGTHVAM
jgi:solute carrier family 25 S-adenosylmethionine transporter 26